MQFVISSFSQRHLSSHLLIGSEESYIRGLTVPNRLRTSSSTQEELKKILMKWEKHILQEILSLFIIVFCSLIRSGVIKVKYYSQSMTVEQSDSRSLHQSWTIKQRNEDITEPNKGLTVKMAVNSVKTLYLCSLSGGIWALLQFISGFISTCLCCQQ